MKSTQRPFKPPKPQEPKSSAPPLKSDLTPVNNEELNFRQEPDHALISNEPPEPPKVEPQVTGKRNKKKIDSPPASKPHIPFQDRPEEPELPPEPCQHMQFLDCNSEVALIITALTALTLTSCSTTTAEQYEATALTSYSWQVKTIQNSKFKIQNY